MEKNKLLRTVVLRDSEGNEVSITREAGNASFSTELQDYLELTEDALKAFGFNLKGVLTIEKPEEEEND